MKHVRITNANIEPVFLAFRHNDVLAELIKKYAAQEPVYHFKAPVDGFIHQFWVIDNKEDQDAITEEFAKMDSLYIADGHHRSAAAARVVRKKAKKRAGESTIIIWPCVFRQSNLQSWTTIVWLKT